MLKAIQADFASMADLLDRPRLYRQLARQLGRVTAHVDRLFHLGGSMDSIETVHQQVFEIESTVGLGLPDAEGLTAILLDQTLFMLRHRRRRSDDLSQPILKLYGEREDQLLERIAGVDYVTGSDLRHWLPGVPARPFGALPASQQTALRLGLEQLQVLVLIGEIPLRFRSLERVGADYPGHPFEEHWRTAFRLARMVGDEAAREVFRERFFGGDPTWRARRAMAGGLATLR